MKDRMSTKAYAKFDKFFMAFGSIMNGLQHVITEKNAEQMIDTAVKKAWEAVSQITDKAYDETEEIDDKSQTMPL
jgi:hypothetical protein